MGIFSDNQHSRPRRGRGVGLVQPLTGTSSALDRYQACGDQQTPCGGTHDDGGVASLSPARTTWNTRGVASLRTIALRYHRYWMVLAWGFVPGSNEERQR